MAIEGSSSSCESPVVRYRNRLIRPVDLEFIRSTIEQDRSLTRPQLYKAICEAWDWRQANSDLSVLACGDLLRRLEEWGHIQLPAPRWKRADRPPLPILPLDWISLAEPEIHRSDVDLDDLVVRPIAKEERLGWRLFMQRYHYLGYRTLVGEHLLYAASLGNDLVALLAWSAAALHAPLRETYIGWGEHTKRKRLYLVANNTRFLMLPWVKVPHLASKVLALNLRRLSADWQSRRNHPIYLAETFVDTARFRGTCYRASNWRYLGETAGRSKQGNRYVKHSAPKALYVYPLHRHAQRLLRGEEASESF